MPFYLRASSFYPRELQVKPLVLHQDSGKTCRFTLGLPAVTPGLQVKPLVLPQG
jgi:hypothetical protein